MNDYTVYLAVLIGILIFCWVYMFVQVRGLLDRELVRTAQSSTLPRFKIQQICERCHGLTMSRFTVGTPTLVRNCKDCKSLSTADAHARRRF